MLLLSNLSEDTVLEGRSPRGHRLSGYIPLCLPETLQFSAVNCHTRCCSMCGRWYRKIYGLFTHVAADKEMYKGMFVLLILKVSLLTAGCFLSTHKTIYLSSSSPHNCWFYTCLSHPASIASSSIWRCPCMWAVLYLYCNSRPFSAPFWDLVAKTKFNIQSLGTWMINTMT